jgi:hypothetical protein
MEGLDFSALSVISKKIAEDDKWVEENPDKPTGTTARDVLAVLSQESSIAKYMMNENITDAVPSSANRCAIAALLYRETGVKYTVTDAYIEAVESYEGYEEEIPDAEIPYNVRRFVNYFDHYEGDLDAVMQHELKHPIYEELDRETR